MRLPSPLPPPYDPLEWQRTPWHERIRMVCAAWTIQGYGAPVPVYMLYLLKVGAFVLAWGFFCSFSPGLGSWPELATWAWLPVAFQKAILWAMLFEVLGLGCGSGPLTGRYFPPVGGLLYWLRPGTVRLPLFPKLALLGGDRRGLLDVALYAAFVVLLLRALVAPGTSPGLDPALLLPIAVLLPVMGLRDKTLFLAARGEHYWTTTVCFLFLDDWIAGAMAVQLAIWLWAATSKLTHHFPSVVCVMTSNSPVLRSHALRKAMVRSFPDDLRPSKLAVWLAHAGTVTELSFPLLLAFGAGGPATLAGLVVMAGFHAYITSNFPMAVPIEWNVVVVYGAFFLFWQHPDIAAWSIASPVLALFLLGMLVGVPLVGNLAPRHVSFLLSMRYYAGNWAMSTWLFEKGSDQKLDQGLVKSAPLVMDQLRMFYDEATAVGMVGKVLGFRHMHLHGRALHGLLPQAVDDIDRYDPIDGELVAGLVLGYNFGDGHLHDEQLLAAVQTRCGFAPGQLRCVFVESQPLHRQTLAWRIVDAATGPVADGEIAVSELRRRMPWPDADPWAGRNRDDAPFEERGPQ